MAGRGPTPKEPSQRRRTNAEAPRTKLGDAPKKKAPPLPGSDGYDERTQAWYATWASAPQASAFVATDWQRLHMLAPLVDAYWQHPSKELMGEIRLNESLLGAVAADRMRLRWDLPSSDQSAAPKAAAPAGPDRKGEALRLLRGEAG